MKTICIAGRVTKDAELRRTQAGDAVLGFSVAVDDFNGKEKRGLFFDCSLWGSRGSTLEKYIVKGTQISVSGEFSTRESESGKTYLTIRANDVALQGGKKQESGQSQQAQSYATASGGSAALDDAIPFAMEWR